ncbi:hypothetical protein [Pseudomonas mosselii]|uniref:Uncharacterized protein n=1 Tax=Pseudomonas mosselii TaxID=78327 RepID=A0ABX9AWE3_9PSED|nr:hypothetical protein [Pseudomonas mosselii]MCL8298402.1 hypothetical protein [Pseudomonas mosselii]MCL8338399.1 hypothetical protein [Pseudomonas mosselii]QZP24872.1 hypothetical protein K5H97_18800 [Pseudomonas mosselii]WJR26498.1 hypothetical protein LU678_019195 [Pseudomonas mosselii]
MTGVTNAEVAKALGRPLTKYEELLVELASPAADIAEVVEDLLLRGFLAVLEDLLGRPLSPTEKAYARQAFYDRIPVAEVARAIENRAPAVAPKAPASKASSFTPNPGDR